MSEGTVVTRWAGRRFCGQELLPDCRGEGPWVKERSGDISEEHRARYSWQVA
jgi:hypothetical protein